MRVDAVFYASTTFLAHKFCSVMQKYFFALMAAALIGFSTWLYMRNNIWNGAGLFPTEMVMIYARDSSTFFIALRLFFLALWAWGAYQLWASNRSVFIWGATIMYLAFLLTDNALLYDHYTQFKQEGAILGKEFPWILFRGVLEAIFTFLFHLIVVRFLRISNKKRLHFEMA